MVRITKLFLLLSYLLFYFFFMSFCMKLRTTAVQSERSILLYTTVKKPFNGKYFDFISVLIFDDIMINKFRIIL